MDTGGADVAANGAVGMPAAARALAGFGSAFAGRAVAGATFGPGQPAAVTDATLETGLPLPSRVVPGGFGEVRVNVAASGAGKGEVI